MGSMSGTFSVGKLPSVPVFALPCLSGVLRGLLIRLAMAPRRKRAPHFRSFSIVPAGQCGMKFAFGVEGFTCTAWPAISKLEFSLIYASTRYTGVVCPLYIYIHTPDIAQTLIQIVLTSILPGLFKASGIGVATEAAVG